MATRSQLTPEEKGKIIGLLEISGKVSVIQKYGDRKESTIRTFWERWKAGGKGEVARVVERQSCQRVTTEQEQ